MDSQLLILIACGAVLLVGMVGIVLLIFLPPARSREESRLAGVSGSQVGSGMGSRNGGSRYGAWQTGSQVSTGSRSEKSEKSVEMTNRLVQAGLYRRNSVGYYMFIKVTLAMIPVAVGAIAAALGTITYMQGIGLGVLLALIATILPSFWLDMKKRERQMNIRRALPDALDVIVVCLEAGLSFRAALSRVAKELQVAHALLVAELMIVEREIQLGCAAGEALRHFADRFDLEELRGLASVVTQAEKFGASIARALRVHAEDLRVKRFQRAEELAQKASVKLLFPTMFCIFPTLYVVLIGPAVFEIMEFFATFGP